MECGKFFRGLFADAGDLTLLWDETYLLVKHGRFSRSDVLEMDRMERSHHLKRLQEELEAESDAYHEATKNFKS